MLMMPTTALMSHSGAPSWRNSRTSCSREALVITVEPKVDIPEKNIAIIIEDMILFTQRGHENLSDSGHSALGGRPRSVNGFRGQRVERHHEPVRPLVACGDDEARPVG